VYGNAPFLFAFQPFKLTSGTPNGWQCSVFGDGFDCFSGVGGNAPFLGRFLPFFAVFLGFCTQMLRFFSSCMDVFRFFSELKLPRFLGGYAPF